MKVNYKPWSKICFYLLKQITFIFLFLLLILSLKKTIPSINQLLKLNLVTIIDLGHHDKKIEHWKDTIKFLLKDGHNIGRKILKDNLKKIICKSTSFVFTNAKTINHIKAKTINTLRFTKAYYYKLVLMAFLLRVYIISFAYFNFL